MELKYSSLKELYTLTGLTRYQIARKLHVSPNTMRKWKAIEDVPERLLYKMENLVIYKANRLRQKKDENDIEEKIRQEVHDLISKGSNDR